MTMEELDDCKNKVDVVLIRKKKKLKKEFTNLKEWTLKNWKRKILRKMTCKNQCLKNSWNNWTLIKT